MDSWRAANPNIKRLWWLLDHAVTDLLTAGVPSTLAHGLTIRKQGPLMRLRLPSGRELAYVRPRYDDEVGITYEGQIQAGGWGRQETYGAKLVENVTQATARDCLAETMFRLENRGIRIVFHVHDEVICEVPKGAYTPEDIAEIMGQPIDWAPGLPLRADAYECGYYRKD